MSDNLTVRISKLSLSAAPEFALALANRIEAELALGVGTQRKAQLAKDGEAASKMLQQRLRQLGANAQLAIEVARPIALAGVHAAWLTGVDILKGKQAGLFQHGGDRSKIPAGTLLLDEIGPRNSLQRWQQIARADWEDLVEILQEVGTDIPSARGALSIWLSLKPDTPPMPSRKFGVIYADPPWEYDFSQSESRSIGAHYKPMSTEAIAALNVPVTEDAVLFLWATNPKLLAAVEVMAAWGFAYKTNMVWTKDKIGPGYYARQQHELLLIGAKGATSPPAEELRPPSVISAPRGEHSEKPDLVYSIIESMYPNRQKIELFARRVHPGWTVWGNEIEK